MSSVNELAAFLQSADNAEPVTETTAGTDEVVEPQESEQLEVEQAEELVEAEQAEVDTEEEESEPWYSVKVNGEEYQVTLDEALKGYQRDADYRKKTMSLAEERKEFDALRSNLTNLIGEIDSFVKREDESADYWEQLKQNDPQAFIAKKEQLEKAEELKQKAEKERMAYMQELVAMESKAFLEAMGGNDVWTQEQRQNDMKSATEYLQSVGMSDGDISKIVDHRLWLVIMDAAKAKKLQEATAKVEDKIRKAPKSVKPGQRLPVGERKFNEAKSKIKNARNSQDGVRALAELLKLKGD